MSIMSRLRAALSPRPHVDLTTSGAFAVTTESIDPSLFGLTTWDTTSFYGPVGPIDRRSAMGVPAVKRARDIIAGTIGQLPVYVLTPKNERQSRPLLTQPEAAVARSVTMTRTVEDLLLEGVSWWRIVGFGWDGRPAQVVRLEPRTVDVRTSARVYVRRDGSAQGTAWEHVPDELLIRIDSPNDPVLTACSRPIRMCLKLEAAADRYADSPQAREYFSPADGADPADDSDITDLLTDWKTARQSGVTGYVPAALKLNQVQAWSPAELQLAEARQHAALEVARATGIDPEDLGVPVTSRTYANMVDRRMWLQDMVLGPYVTAVQDRLSMDDVTLRGYRVRFDFAGFTRSGEAERLDTYGKAVAMGLYDLSEVARREELPEPPKPKPAPAPAGPDPADPAADPAPEETTVQNSAPAPAATFTQQHFTIGWGDIDAAFRVDPKSRTITGIAVPYGPIAHKDGSKFRFHKGSLRYSDPKRVKLLRDHNPDSYVGVMINATETDAGMSATFKVARTPAGDEVLALAADGVLDGLSVGVDWEPNGIVLGDDGVADVTGALWRETSITGFPAFADARVTGVTASDHPKETSAMPCTLCGHLHAPGPCPAPAPAPDAAASFTADDVADALVERFSAMAPRPVVPAGAPLLVREEAPYRFGAAEPGAHDFSTDLFAGLRGNSEARQRAETFAIKAMGERFAVGTSNVTEVNPTTERPDMYVDRIAETRKPVYNALYKGAVTDGTPFRFPGFDSASGLVADHTQGVEPTSGSFETKLVNTITPKAKSGKVEIWREVIDAGGNPQVSTLIWREMTRAWDEALETEAVALLTGLTGFTSKTITTGAVDDGLSDEVERIISDLEFQVGGARQDIFLTHANLHNALISAKDGAGRKLYPTIGAQNATGTTSARFRSVDVGGFPAQPAWSLGAASSAVGYSWMLATEDLHVWASAPRRFDFEYQVKSVEMALWGWVATGWSRTATAIKIGYDPVV